MALISGWFLMKVLATILFILVGVYFYFKHVLFNYWKKRGVVHLKPSVPLGNFGEILTGKTTLGEYFERAYAEHKKNDYFGMYIFYKPSLVITNLDLVKDVLVRGFGSFHDRGVYYNEEADPFSANLFQLPGTKWRNLRTKLTPTFSSGKIKNMFETMADRADALACYLEPKAQNHELIEVKDLFARFGTDVIMNTAFGISCNSLQDPDNEYRIWGRRAVQPRPFFNVLTLFGSQILQLLSLSATDKEVTKFFMNSFKRTVEYRQTNQVTRPDFVNLLIQLMNKGQVDIDESTKAPSITENPDGKVTISEAAAQAFIFFLGAFETTSSSLSLCLYELAKNQEAQDKVRADIHAGLKKSGGLTYESIDTMPYLQKVLAETLRLYPQFPVLNRQCNQDIELPGTNLHLSKGLDIVIPVFGIHRDPEIYPEPEKFDPERFNEENTAARHPFAYLPFGEGPRICIGKRFAYVNIKVALISVLSKYRVWLAPNMPNSLKMDPGVFLTSPLDGIYMRFEQV